MAEYWKSLPRKFCDVCKCWFADNKASIDFHERGKRHQENAQKRIQEIQKRGAKEFKKQKQLEDEMAKIEKAALAAYQKDLKNMQDGDKTNSSPQPLPKSTTEVTKNVKSSKNNSEKKKEVAHSVKQKEVAHSVKQKEVAHSVKQKEVAHSVKQNEVAHPVKQKEVPPSKPANVWYEGMSEEGYKYYWNSETSESQWDPPEEGYISIEEQSETNCDTAAEEQKVPEEKDSTENEEKNNIDISNSVGPQPKIDPYGQWTTVEKEEPIEYDFQLPKQSENIVEVVIPLYKDGPSIKFKEKVIGQLTDGDSGEVTFKKRKFSGAQKRNARQRTTDDD